MIGIGIELEHDMGIILLFCFANCTLIASHSQENKKCMGENQVKWQRSGGGGGKWLKGLTSFHHVPSLSLRLLCAKSFTTFCSMVLKPCRCCSGWTCIHKDYIVL